jgi:arylsulfatase A-like enzyme
LNRIAIGFLISAIFWGECWAGAKPNVVLIMPDDLSYSDYSYYNPGGPRTPNIDTLARSSVRLSDFHVAPTCSPSRSQLMTGRYANACGVWHTIMGRYFLRTNEVTMADVFKANGYRTALFGKWHLGDNYPFRPKDRGFEHCVSIRGGGIDQQPDYWGNRNTVPCTLYDNDQPVVLNETNGALPGCRPPQGVPNAFSTDFFTTEAINYIKDCHARQDPFFVYLPYNVAHDPCDMPPDARPRIDAHTATIENMDKNVGRLLEFLDASGLGDNTLLVFIPGDNGMANSRFRGDKATEYEAGHRVPCFMRWPAGGYAGTPEAAREIPQLTSEMDLLPTLMDVLGLHDVTNRSPEVAINGRSLKALLDSNPAYTDMILGKRVLVVDNQRFDDLVKYKQACVMQDQLNVNGQIIHKWRLIQSLESQPWELYDILVDQLEQTNLLQSSRAGSFDAIVHPLEAAYEVWWRDVSTHASDYSRPIIGSPAELVSCLNSHDWHMSAGYPPWNQTMIAAGLAANGFHAVTFERAGDYTFDLRRWPREIASETAVDSQLRTPIRVTETNALTYGKALPVRSARIRVWNGNQTYADERQAVKPGSSGAVFTLPLPAGPAMVQTWFYNTGGKELCGAYYVYVKANRESQSVDSVVGRASRGAGAWGN